MADTRVLPGYTADAHASSHGPDQCDTHSAARHGVAKGGATTWYSACTCLKSLGVPCSQGRWVPHKCMGTSHPPGPTTEVTPLRQRSNLLQSVMLRADVERMLPVPEPQQHGPIPVWAAPLNYREVDLPVKHLAELDSVDGEVMCHAAHNISCRIFSDRESTVARRASSATFAQKPSTQARPSGPGIGETPEHLLEGLPKEVTLSAE